MDCNAQNSHPVVFLAFFVTFCLFWGSLRAKVLGLG